MFEWLWFIVRVFCVSVVCVGEGVVVGDTGDVLGSMCERVGY